MGGQVFINPSHNLNHEGCKEKRKITAKLVFCKFIYWSSISWSLLEYLPLLDTKKESQIRSSIAAFSRRDPNHKFDMDVNQVCALVMYT